MDIDGLIQRIDQHQADTGTAVVWVRVSSRDWMDTLLKLARRDTRVELLTDRASLEAGVVAQLVDKGIWIQVQREIQPGALEFSTVP